MTNKILTMKLIDESYGVCRLERDEVIPQWSQVGDFFSITRTSEELSIVCAEANIPGEVKCERDWRVLKIEGPLDFSLIGILAPISTILAQQNISIFAISTYDTDYILVKNKDIDKAVKTLIAENYEIVS